MRLFVAVWPPDDLLDALAALPRPVRPGLRWTTRDQWHVTLRFLGRVDDPRSALAPLEDLDWRALGRPVASAGPATVRLGSSLVVLPVAGLAGLAAAVVGATADVGERPPSRPFVGHVTLARAKRGGGGGGGGAGAGGVGGGVAGLAGEAGTAGEAGAGGAGVAGLTGAAVSAVWPVSEVTLVASDRQPQGARYEVIARFSLG